MNPSSLTARLAIAFALLVALTAVVFSAAGYVSTERQVTGQVDNFLRERAQELVEGQRGRPGPGDEDRRRNDRRRGVDDDSLIQILDNTGTIAATSGDKLPVTGGAKSIAQGKSDRPLLQTVATEDGELRIITVSVPEGGAVQVARELEESRNTVSGLQERLIAIAIIAALLAAALGAGLARRIVNPIKQLAATVDSVAATRDFSTPIKVSGSDEVERLASGFDNLLRSLDASQQQQNQLVQDVAHELRTPLTSIRANVDMLAMAPDMDVAERQQTLDSVRLELRELTTLVNEIVDVAAQGGEPTTARESLDLAAVTVEAVERFRLRTGRVVTVDAKPTMVVADQDGVLRALANLLSNADKYSESDEPVAVTVPGDGWIHVADRGVGMSVEDRERAFDRFYRADEARAQPGSGLGLAIVRTIAEAHRGKAQLTENPGGGTIASLYLPV